MAPSPAAVKKSGFLGGDRDLSPKGGALHGPSLKQATCFLSREAPASKVSAKRNRVQATAEE